MRFVYRHINLKPYLPIIFGGFLFLGYGNDLASESIVVPVNSPQVLGISTNETLDSVGELVKNKTEVITTTAFPQKEKIVNEKIPYETEYKKDSDMEYGEEKILTEGTNGNKKTTYKITFWGDEEIDREVVNIETEKPKTEIVAKGTKIVWRTLQTADAGKVKYWRKMRVWATKYDGNCFGCRGLTYSGTVVVKGVCAVDPKTIQLGTTFYVEGYGMCHAEDIGGAIKGNKIDLGFVDAAKGAWGAAYTNIYIITSVPDDGE